MGFDDWLLSATPVILPGNRRIPPSLRSVHPSLYTSSLLVNYTQCPFSDQPVSSDSPDPSPLLGVTPPLQLLPQPPFPRSNRMPLLLPTFNNRRTSLQPGPQARIPSLMRTITRVSNKLLGNFNPMSQARWEWLQSTL